MASGKLETEDVTALGSTKEHGRSVRVSKSEVNDVHTISMRSTKNDLSETSKSSTKAGRIRTVGRQNGEHTLVESNGEQSNQAPELASS